MAGKVVGIWAGWFLVLAVVSGVGVDAFTLGLAGLFITAGAVVATVTVAKAKTPGS